MISLSYSKPAHSKGTSWFSGWAFVQVNPFQQRKKDKMRNTDEDLDYNIYN